MSAVVVTTTFAVITRGVSGTCPGPWGQSKVSFQHLAGAFLVGCKRRVGSGVCVPAACSLAKGLPPKPMNRACCTHAAAAANITSVPVPCTGICGVLLRPNFQWHHRKGLVS